MNIKNKLYEIIKNELSIIYEGIPLNDDLELINDLGYDSITLMQLVLDVEETFSIEFDEDTNYEEISTIGLLVNYITEKIHERDNVNI